MPWFLAPIMGLVEMGKGIIERKQEKTRSKHARDLAVIDNQTRLAMATKEFNHSWEMASLQDKDRFLRGFSFVLFTFPIIITVILPDYAEQMFTNLDMVPEWLMQIWFYMIAGVWGIASLKDSVTEIVASIKEKRAK